MTALPSYFRDFLSEIRPTKYQRGEMRSGHETLRKRLRADEDIKKILVSDFLQGSYRRATAIRPVKEARSDVDVVVVTNLDPALVTPQDAMELFRPFLRKHYRGKYRFQGRSIAIEFSYVDLDLVITSAPSEVDKNALQWPAVTSSDSPEDVNDWRFNSYWVPLEARQAPGAGGRLLKSAQESSWKSKPLLIPNRDAAAWELTHPLAQIAWTFAKNASTQRHFVNIVKSAKWWRKVKHEKPKHPKGYPLEHIVGECCPDSIASVAEGITRTLEGIRDRFHSQARARLAPYLPDREIDQNVLKRLAGEDFAQFHEQVTAAADLARRAFDETITQESAQLWRELLGDKFPKPPAEKQGRGGAPAFVTGGFSERTDLSVPPRGRFA